MCLAEPVIAGSLGCRNFFLRPWFVEKEHSSSCKIKICLTEPVRAWSQALGGSCSLESLKSLSLCWGLWLLSKDWGVLGFQSTWNILCSLCTALINFLLTLSHYMIAFSWLSPLTSEIYEILYFLQNLLDIRHNLWRTSWCYLFYPLYLWSSGPTLISGQVTFLF